MKKYVVDDRPKPLHFNPNLLMVPNFDKERILSLSKLIKPIIELSDRTLTIHNVENDIFSYSYLTQCSVINRLDCDPEEVGRYWTYHTSDRYGTFRPSIAEIIRQIPEEEIRKVNYFMCLGPVDSISRDFQRYSLAQTLLFIK